MLYDHLKYVTVYEILMEFGLDILAFYGRDVYNTTYLCIAIHRATGNWYLCIPVSDYMVGLLREQRMDARTVCMSPVRYLANFSTGVHVGACEKFFDYSYEGSSILSDSDMPGPGLLFHDAA